MLLGIPVVILSANSTDIPLCGISFNKSYLILFFLAYNFVNFTYFRRLNMLTVKCAYVFHHNTLAPMGRVFMKLGMNMWHRVDHSSDQWLFANRYWLCMVIVNLQDAKQNIHLNSSYGIENHQRLPQS
jgi:hypothetical protein